MKTLLISYDLGVPESPADYQKLIEYLQSFINWAHPLQSVWLVETSKSSTVVRDEIRRKTDSNDKFLVLDITVHHWSSFGLGDKVVEWLHSHA